jgi:hypothetical protein
MKRIVWLLLAICTAYAQNLEIGVLGGGGFLPGVPVEGASSPVSAGFQSGPVLGALFAQDMYSRWSGEIRYSFEFENLRLSSGGDSATFGGHAQVLHYDLLFHTRDRESRVRPYFAVGGGVKVYQGTGTEEAYQPLMQYAYLTKTQELKPLLTFGGGVKVHLRGRMSVRFDLRDEVTTFPTQVITPAPGMAINGWVHDFVPSIGLGWGL